MHKPVIILNGLKSIETDLKWTKLDGSPLNYTGKFEQDDIDYGFTAFSENEIHGNAPIKLIVKNNEIISGVLRTGQQNLVCITAPRI